MNCQLLRSTSLRHRSVSFGYCNPLPKSRARGQTCFSKAPRTPSSPINMVERDSYDWYPDLIYHSLIGTGSGSIGATSVAIGDKSSRCSERLLHAAVVDRFGRGNVVKMWIEAQEPCLGRPLCFARLGKHLD